jgi:hypothetical protein
MHNFGGVLAVASFNGSNEVAVFGNSFGQATDFV